MVYYGHGKLGISGHERPFDQICLVLGDRGLTLQLSLIARVVLVVEDELGVCGADANESESDKITHDNLDQLTRLAKEQLQVSRVLFHPSDSWDGLEGHGNNKGIVQRCLFTPQGLETSISLCDPPALMKEVAVPTFTTWDVSKGKFIRAVMKMNLRSLL